MVNWRPRLGIWSSLCSGVVHQAETRHFSMRSQIGLVWFGRIIWSTLPDMDGDTFHYSILLKALTSLAMNNSRDEVSTTSLGNIFQGLTTLIMKKVSLILSPYLCSFSLKLLPLVLSLQALTKILYLSYKLPLYRKTALRSAKNLIFSWLNIPSSLDLSP